MKFADWLRGVANVVTADVVAVFDKTTAIVKAAPIPTNLKNDAVQLIADAKSDLLSAEGLAGTLVGSAMADGVDDLTTLLMNTSQAIGNAKSPADFSKAELTVLQQTWNAMKAQGDTLVTQFMAGIDPTKTANTALAAPTPVVITQPNAAVASAPQAQAAPQ